MKKTFRTSINSIKNQLKQNVIAITSLLVALFGLSANISYMEHKEHNSNLRTASFQLLLELSELEQLTFHLQYDNESAQHNARTGWVKVRLISALTTLMPDEIQQTTQSLFQSWDKNWQRLGEKSPQAANTITENISALRQQLILIIETLK